MGHSFADTRLGGGPRSAKVGKNISKVFLRGILTTACPCHTKSEGQPRTTHTIQKHHIRHPRVDYAKNVLRQAQHTIPFHPLRASNIHVNFETHKHRGPRLKRTILERNATKKQKLLRKAPTCHSRALFISAYCFSPFDPDRAQHPYRRVRNTGFYPIRILLLTSQRSRKQDLAAFCFYRPFRRCRRTDPSHLPDSTQLLPSPGSEGVASASVTLWLQRKKRGSRTTDKNWDIPHAEHDCLHDSPLHPPGGRCARYGLRRAGEDAPGTPNETNPEKRKCTTRGRGGVAECLGRDERRF